MRNESANAMPVPRMLAGDVDYGVHGEGYVRQRRTDPRIAALVHAALGDARTVLNVGAGAGSYEPEDRYVLAIEPSAAMRAQRPTSAAPAVNAVAEELPLDDQSVDASMAMVTVHQWRDVARGLRELVRVTRGPIVILTFDGAALDRLWLADYAPALFAAERPRYPAMETLRNELGPATTVTPVPIPIDCVDGFMDAYYARPEAFLGPNVRRSQSSWSFISEAEQLRIVDALASDLASGEWDRRYGALRSQPFYDGSLRLVVRPA
jgi:SAM-dependent methyltransferase